jgi:hypothetical protein
MAQIDLSQIVNLLNQLLPLIIVLSILPLIFKMLEKAFSA